jgi:hypothetical protein
VATTSVSILTSIQACIAIYACLFAPGQALWRKIDSALPTAFARVALSVVATSFWSLLLCASDSFSLPSVVVLNAGTALCAFLYQTLGRAYQPSAPPVAPERVGPILAIACLAAYLPPYDTFFFGGDSTMYVNAGVHLARTGHLWVADPIVGELGRVLPAALFPSVNLTYVAEPPHTRTLGGLVLMSLDATRAWPAFFPLPSIWAGLGTATFGIRAAGAFTALFCALSVWATFVTARYMMPLAAAFLVALLAAANGAACWFGHFPLSEPLVWFFLWGGLAAANAWEKQRFTADAAVAGLLFGCAILTRPEYLILISSFVAVRWLIASHSDSPRLPVVFFLGAVPPLALTALEIYRIPGAYLLPVTEGLRSAGHILGQMMTMHPAAAVLGAALVIVASYALARRGHATRSLAIVVGLGPTVASIIPVNFQGHYTATWLVLYAGWATLALALCGLVWTWKDTRRERSIGSSLLALTLVVAAPLLWHPHVFLQIPWGARRLIPLLLPATFLFAGVAMTRIGRKSALAATLAAALAVAGIVPSARTTWGTAFFEGSLEQLETFKAAIPDDAILATSRIMANYMIDTPLWLLHGVDSLPVFSASTRIGRMQLGAIVNRFHGKRPVFHVRPAIHGAPPPSAGLRFEKITRLTVSRLFFENADLSLPTERRRRVTYLDLYRVSKVALPPAAAKLPQDSPAL